MPTNPKAPLLLAPDAAPVVVLTSKMLEGVAPPRHLCRANGHGDRNKESSL